MMEHIPAVMPWLLMMSWFATSLTQERATEYRSKTSAARANLGSHATAMGRIDSQTMNVARLSCALVDASRGAGTWNDMRLGR